MKKVCGIVLIIILVTFITACGNTTISGKEDIADSAGNALPENLVMLDVEEWPENEYTANIPQPESGMLLRGWIDPEKEYCYMAFSDMTQAKSEQYVNTLKDSGFLEVEKVSEEISDDYISIGTLLTKDSTVVNIVYGDDSFGIYIKNEKKNNTNYNLQNGDIKALR